MTRGRSESHKRVMDAARKEFLEYGFTDASMRRIAGEAGITASGLYKHFASKEEMFSALVEPTLEAFNELYHKTEMKEFEEIEVPDSENLLTDQTETCRMMTFIYDHLEAFTLILCKARGTKYEDFVHELAVKEEDTTLRYMQKLKDKGIRVKEIDRREFHLLITTTLDSIMQAVKHGFSRKEALHYAGVLDRFYQPAWKQYFGV